MTNQSLPQKFQNPNTMKKSTCLITGIQWIPTDKGLKNLEEIFSEPDIQYITHRARFKIAAWNLLHAIVAAAIGVPKDEIEKLDEKWNLKTRKDEILQYLQTHQEKFQFDTFLQLGDTFEVYGKNGAETITRRHLYEIATTKTNSPIQHSQHEPNDVEIIQSILILQSFAPSGRITGHKWDGKIWDKCSTTFAPAQKESGYHIFQMEDTLLDTIRENLITKEDLKIHKETLGRPIWENIPNNKEEGENPPNLKKSYLEKLCPLSRGIRNENGKYHFSEALSYSEHDILLTTKRYEDKKGDRKILKINEQKAWWRDLHNLLIKINPNDQLAPLALKHNKKMNLWIGGFKFYQGPIIEIDVIQKNLPLTHDEASQWLSYRKELIEYAEEYYRQIIYPAAKTYLYNLNLKKHYDAQKLGIKIAHEYWTELEQYQQTLETIQHTEKEPPKTYKTKEIKITNVTIYKNQWGQACKKSGEKIINNLIVKTNTLEQKIQKEIALKRLNLNVK